MARILLLACLVTVGLHVANASHSGPRKEIIYDSFNSCPISQEVYSKWEKEGKLSECTKKIMECDPNDYRTVDGSCNNLNHPEVGTFGTPFRRILPASFSKGNEVRTALDGSPLPLERKIRTELLEEGTSTHPRYTLMWGTFLIALFGDISPIHDTINLLTTTLTCCKPGAEKNPNCAPIHVPDDDRVHSFSGIRCLNQTKPLTYQHYGCAAENTVMNRVGNVTHALDLGFVYGPVRNHMELARTYKGGLLKSEYINGLHLPLKGDVSNCLANVLPKEPYCAAQSNNVIGPTLITIMFNRMHNVVAEGLGIVNPCWDDHRLFNEAKEIVIAIWLQISYYELLPLSLGEQHMLDSGLISRSPGFRDIYNPNLAPALALETGYTGRYFHILQEGTIEFYDKNLRYVKAMPLTNLTLRTGFLALDDNLGMINRGSYMQPYGNAFHKAHPNMVNLGLGSLQRSFDILSNDLSKGRHYGLPPYVYYKEFYNPGLKIKTFDDLADIDPVRRHSLKKMYKSVGDIELLAGMWSEKPDQQTQAITPLAKNILTHQFLHAIQSDRFWYERQNRPHAFTLPQLLEIRKVTAATVMCAAAAGVTKIQPRPFLLPGPGNELRSCELIPKLNLWAWKDYNCRS